MKPDLLNSFIVIPTDYIGSQYAIVFVELQNIKIQFQLNYVNINYGLMWNYSWKYFLEIKSNICMARVMWNMNSTLSLMILIDAMV